MKTRHLLLSAVVATSFASAALAQSLAIEVGDTVVAAREGVELKAGKDVLATLKPSDTLRVIDIQGNWVGCQLVADPNSKTGWVRRADLRLPPRTPAPAPAAASVLRTAPAAPSLAIKVGDTVVVARDGAELKVDRQVLARLDEWTASKDGMSLEREHRTELLVTAIQGDWIACQADVDGMTVKGWVQRADVRLPWDGVAEAILAAKGVEYELEFGKLTPSETALRALSGSREVVELVLVPSSDTRPLVHLKSIPNLRSLSFGYADGAGPDATLAHLEELSRLQDLSLGGVTDAGLVHLKKFSKLRKLGLEGHGITDAGMAHLNGLAQLQELSLSGNVTDAGLAHLRGLTQLGTLKLALHEVTGTGLVHLNGLTKLQYLKLEYTPVTDGGLASLRGLLQLRRLDVSGCNVEIGDAAVAHLKWLAQLEQLDLDGTRVTDAGLIYLERLPKLRKLCLGLPQVTGTGLANLRGLKQLRHLHLTQFSQKIEDGALVNIKGLTQLETLRLSSPKLTDAGLAHLSGLTGLRVLDLRHTKVSDEGGKKLREALPNCEVIIPLQPLAAAPVAERDEAIPLPARSPVLAPATSGKTPASGPATAAKGDREKPRIWTDVTGKLKAEATFLDLADGTVRLQKADGKMVTVLLEKLSQPDQEYVKQKAAAGGVTARPAAKPVPRARPVP